jgi:Zn-dependent alcohol dehydrogenase
MPTPARVVVCPGEPGPLRIDAINLPDPGPYHVVVKQYASGICHSQLHQMHNRRPGMPQVLGHESTGVVIAKGSKVKHVQEGDMVFVTWVPRDAARMDRRLDNPVLTLADGSTAQGVFTWADTTIADEQFVVKVPQDTKRDVTAIIGCAVMTGSGAVYHTARVQKGQSVAVFGVGGVGLSAIAAAKVVGADPIIAVDLDEAKLGFAKQFGATVGVNASEGDPVAKIKELTEREGEFDMRGNPVSGVDFAFDCIGVRVTMEQILPAVRPGVLGKSTGGTAVLVGVPQTPVEIQAIDLLINEKKYIGSIGGSCRPDRDFPMFLRWYREGLLDLDAMVTARYKLDDINQATDDLQNGKIFGRAILEF